MEAITLETCFTGGWRDGFGAIRARPLLCIVVFLLALLAGFVNLQYSTALTIAKMNGGSPSAGLTLAQLCLVVLELFGYAMLGIHTYRYTILGAQAAREGSLLNGTFWRYVWASIQIGLLLGVCMVVCMAIGVGLDYATQSTSFALTATLAVLAVVAMIYVLVRVGLIFPQIATGRRKSWRAAWHDSRGHFWIMWGTVFLTTLPMIGILLLFAVVLYFTMTYAVPGSSALVNVVVQAAVAVIWITVTAAVHGWLYRRFANQLLATEAQAEVV